MNFVDHIGHIYYNYYDVDLKLEILACVIDWVDRGGGLIQLNGQAS